MAKSNTATRRHPSLSPLVLMASKETCTQAAQNGKKRFRVFAVFFVY
jgi:hypothetical protein